MESRLGAVSVSQSEWPLSHTHALASRTKKEPASRYNNLPSPGGAPARQKHRGCMGDATALVVLGRVGMPPLVWLSPMMQSPMMNMRPRTF